jgi:hypothetical protein
MPKRVASFVLDTIYAPWFVAAHSVHGVVLHVAFRANLE